MHSAAGRDWSFLIGYTKLENLLALLGSRFPSKSRRLKRRRRPFNVLPERSTAPALVSPVTESEA
jgi:hypothetical protein